MNDYPIAVAAFLYFGAAPALQSVDVIESVNRDTVNNLVAPSETVASSTLRFC